MKDRKRSEFPTHIEGIPVATRSNFDTLARQAVDSADNLVKRTKSIKLPFLSDTVNERRLIAWDNNHSVRKTDTDLIYIGEQILEITKNSPPVTIKVKDLTGNEYNGTFWSGQYLKQFYQVDLFRDDGNPFDMLCLDFPIALMNQDDIYCLAEPGGFKCRNQEVLEIARNLTSELNIEDKYKKRIMKSHSALHSVLLEHRPELYDLSDWNIVSHDLTLFKFTDLGLGKKISIGSETEYSDWTEELLYRTEIVKGERARLADDYYHNTGNLKAEVATWNAYIRLYHLQKGSSEKETKRGNVNLKTLPSRI